VSRRRLAAAAVILVIAGCGDQHGNRRDPGPAVMQVAAGGEVATAFALGPGELVTVAHVLGRRAPGATVRLQGGRRATIRAVDERDDLALLAVPGLRAPRAALDPAARGKAGVLVVRRSRVRTVPATIRRAITATIRTPDGRRVVRRPALELRADVEPGDSGAPVVTPDGRIAGVVFAQSDAREHVAYAVRVSAFGARLRRPAGRS
jgi:S1-C subfamily serine protease